MEVEIGVPSVTLRKRGYYSLGRNSLQPMAIGTFLVDSGSAGDTTVRIGGRLRGERVFVPIVSNDQETVSNQVKVASIIATATDGCCRVATLGTDQQQTIEPRTAPDQLDDILTWATDQAGRSHDRWNGGLLESRRLEREIRRLVERDGWDTLLLPPLEQNGYVTGHHQRRLYEDPPCGVLTVNCETDFREYASMLLPIANGPHSGLATDVAAVIAHQCDAYIDILHVIDPEASEDTREAAERRVQTAADRVGLDERTSTWILESADPADEIIEQSAYYGLTIIGAPQTSRLHRFVYGSMSTSISSEAESAVVSVSAETRP